MDPFGTMESKILTIACLLLILTDYLEKFTQESKTI